jgi:hypothetical protein
VSGNCNCQSNTQRVFTSRTRWQEQSKWIVCGEERERARKASLSVLEHIVLLRVRLASRTERMCLSASKGNGKKREFGRVGHLKVTSASRNSTSESDEECLKCRFKAPTTVGLGSFWEEGERRTKMTNETRRTEKKEPEVALSS